MPETKRTGPPRLIDGESFKEVRPGVFVAGGPDNPKASAGAGRQSDRGGSISFRGLLVASGILLLGLVVTYLGLTFLARGEAPRTPVRVAREAIESAAPAEGLSPKGLNALAGSAAQAIQKGEPDRMAELQAAAEAASGCQYRFFAGFHETGDFGNPEVRAEARSAVRAAGYAIGFGNTHGHWLAVMENCG